MAVAPDAHICWALLASSDPAGSVRFYEELAGWEPSGADAGPQTLLADGRAAAAVDALEPPLAANGVPSHWRSFVRVPDAAALVARGRELGGFTPGEPRQLGNAAVVAPVFDPQGASLAAWQPVDDDGFKVTGEIGTFVLFELQARDVDAARDFYSRLLGWEASTDTDGYTTFAAGGVDVAAMQERDPRWGEAPPLWLPYIRVASCDDAAARIVELGGIIVSEPADHPLGRRAIAHDPQDALVAVLETASS